MLPEDVEGTASSLDGQRQRRRVEFNQSDEEDSSDSERDESDFVEEEGEEQGAESELSARTKQKCRLCRRQSPHKKGMECYIPVLNIVSLSTAVSIHVYRSLCAWMHVHVQVQCTCMYMYSRTSVLDTPEVLWLEYSVSGIKL